MLLVALAATAAVVLVAGTLLLRFQQRGAAPIVKVSKPERENWRMPALALLERPQWALGRRVAIYAMGGYLVVSIIMLAVKAFELAGHG